MSDCAGIISSSDKACLSSAIKGLSGMTTHARVGTRASTDPVMLIAPPPKVTALSLRPNHALCEQTSKSAVACGAMWRT